jgi:hypothetical protein
MAMKEQPKMIYRSMQGKEINMGKLISRNENSLAVGNMKVNARGDQIGPGGKVIKTREQLQAEQQKGE